MTGTDWFATHRLTLEDGTAMDVMMWATCGEAYTKDDWKANKLTAYRGRDGWYTGDTPPNDIGRIPPNLPGARIQPLDVAVPSDRFHRLNTPWITPPECHGQTVEISYAYEEGGQILRRMWDHSDNEVTIDTFTDPDPDGEFDPWNGTPALGKKIGFTVGLQNYNDPG